MSIDRRIYSFQYRLISCYVLLLISLAVYAQSGKERFVGRVVDTETNQPVPFATVRLLALPDSILLVGGATDIQGKFQLAVTIRKASLFYCISLISDIPLFIGLYLFQQIIRHPLWVIYL